MFKTRHSVEQLALLQQYLIFTAILFGFPGVALWLKKDHRIKFALILYVLISLLWIFLYISDNKIFFPDDTVLLNSNKKMKAGPVGLASHH